VKYISCIVCGEKVKAERVDKRYCDKCLHQHTKILRQKRDRNEVSKLRYKRYRNTDKYREYARNRYHTMPEDKKKARYLVTNAIRDGLLVRANNCQLCGVPDSGVDRSTLEAHHYLGYDKENVYKIIWLCVSCHKQADSIRG
jgi:hypothetical protein